VVTFRIDNVGTAAAGAFDVLVRADPALATTGTVAVGGLAAGASTGALSTTLGPANNCFDPDCTIQVQADSGNTVPESNEANNTDTETFIG
jgi:subtilase family serine protease